MLEQISVQIFTNIDMKLLVYIKDVCATESSYFKNVPEII